jgi:predicted NAD/FAD-binding protein
LDGSRYRLLYDILRFNHTALDVLRPGSGLDGVDLEVTVDQYLTTEGYSSVFRDRYLLVRPRFRAGIGNERSQLTLEIAALFMYPLYPTFRLGAIPHYLPRPDVP